MCLEGQIGKCYPVRKERFAAEAVEVFNAITVMPYTVGGYQGLIAQITCTKHGCALNVLNERMRVSLWPSHFHSILAWFCAMGFFTTLPSWAAGTLGKL